MKKFKYPLSISGTPEELKALVPKLEALGYRNTNPYQERHHWLITRFGGRFDDNFDERGFNQTEDHSESTIVPASNPELVLALAACVEGDEFHVGEYGVLKTSYNNERYFKQYKLYKYARHNVYGVSEFINERGIPDGFGSNECFRKATKEEIISHFTKQENTYTPTTSDMKKIKGYKFKPGFEKFEKAASEIFGSTLSCLAAAPHQVTMLPSGSSFERIKEAGVLDLWFEPVYEEEFKVGDWVVANCGSKARYIGKYKAKTGSGRFELSAWSVLGQEYEPHNGGLFDEIERKATTEEIEAATKPKEITIEIQAEDVNGDCNNFNVYVSKGNISTGNESVDVEQFKRILAHCKTTLNGWECSVRTVDIGCKRNISVADLQKVLDAYNSF